MKKTALVVLLLASFSLTLYAAPEPGIITGTQVNFRQEPGAAGKVIGRLNRPERVTILGWVLVGSDRWYEIITASGTKGYVSAGFAAYESVQKAAPWTVDANDEGKITISAGGREIFRDTFDPTGGPKKRRYDVEKNAPRRLSLRERGDVRLPAALHGAVQCREENRRDQAQGS